MAFARAYEPPSRPTHDRRSNAAANTSGERIGAAFAVSRRAQVGFEFDLSGSFSTIFTPFITNSMR
jgi:hypothetical protein